MRESADGSGLAASYLTDAIGVGTLTRLVTRELADEVIAALGRTEIRKNKLPARVVAYFVMALALFSDDSYEEVMRKLSGGLKYMGTWRREWEVPTASALCQARERLGADVMRELFRRVAVPCALRSTAGAWLAGRRLMAVDGFGLDAPDSEENGAHFGYMGKKGKTAFPQVHMAAMVECGTHAIVAAEIGEDGVGETTLTGRILSSGAVEPGMVVMADAGLYSYRHLKMIVDSGADAILRVGANVGIPVLEWLPDGSYRSFIADPAVKGKMGGKLASGLVKITDLPGFHVRAIDYEVTGRGDGDELITVITTIADPADVPAIDVAGAYHERWESEGVFDEVKTHLRGPGKILRSRRPELAEQEIWGILLAHYGIRHLMREAADQAEVDPDRMSFIRALRVVRRQVSSQAAFSPSEADGGRSRGN